MILAAADKLLARAGIGKEGTVANETAQVLHDLAQQVAAFTVLQERRAKRLRIALVLGSLDLAPRGSCVPSRPTTVAHCCTSNNVPP
jgi:hypothetical protein